MSTLSIHSCNEAGNDIPDYKSNTNWQYLNTNKAILNQEVVGIITGGNAGTLPDGSTAKDLFEKFNIFKIGGKSLNDVLRGIIS